MTYKEESFTKKIYNYLRNNRYYEFIVSQCDDFKLFYKLKTSDSKKRIILTGTPHHGNMGDQAIADAVTDILNSATKQKQILEIPENQYFRILEKLPKYISSEDVFFVNGGGFVGMLWPGDKLIKDIVSRYRNNTVTIFPQTVYYSEDENGSIALKNVKEIYSNHSNLTIYLRENKSYKIFSDLFQNTSVTVKLCPDIVFSQNKSIPIHERDGIYVCLRTDQESILSSETRENIISSLRTLGIPVSPLDINVHKLVPLSKRETELEAMYDKFRSAKIIITDRMHGMVFSTITSTPCIIIRDLTGKAQQSYEWISYLEYVKPLENMDELLPLAEKMLHIEKTEYDNDSLNPYYEELITHVRGQINEDN